MSDVPAAPASLAELDEEDLRWHAPSRPLYRLGLSLRANPTLVAGLTLLGMFTAVSLSAWHGYGNALGSLVTNSALAQTLAPPPPSAAHPFGVMNGIGIDILTALYESTPTDLVLVASILIAALSVGVVLGSVAALRGGGVDGLVTVVSDLLVAVPPFFFVMVLFLGIQRFVPPNGYLPAFVGLFAFVLWPSYARSTRARAAQVARSAYVEAARSAGASFRRLLRRHVIPNSFFPVLAQVPVDVYNIFFVLTAFPFLACFNPFFTLLSPLPNGRYAEWGYLLAQGACYGWSPLASINHWWMYTFPALTILTFGVAVALTCDGLERYLLGPRGQT